jgi:hypothetical protein
MVRNDPPLLARHLVLRIRTHREEKEGYMVRARLLSLTLAASAAVFSSGCQWTSGCQPLSSPEGGGFLSRLNPFHRTTPECGCMEGGDVVVSNGPTMTEGPMLVPPQGGATSTPPPRIITVPQQQAPSVPYTPTGLRK